MASDEDAVLFRTSIGAVTPLAAQNRIAHVKPVTQARVRSAATLLTINDCLVDLPHVEAPETYQRNGVSHLTLRKLRHSLAQDTLDLHGFTIDAARLLLQQFLLAASQNHFRCLLVIHGKGSNSPGGDAILRTLTRNWLIQHPHVLAFCPASAESGGSGAVLILLKAVDSKWFTPC